MDEINWTAPGLIQRDGQYEFNGVLFNGDSMPRFMVTEVRGLWGTPDMKDDDVNTEAGNGSIPGVSYYGDRMIEMDITILGTNPGDIPYMLSKLSAACQIHRNDVELFYKKPGQDMKCLYGRPYKMIFPSTSDAVLAKSLSGTIQIKCNDPLIYRAQWTKVQATMSGAGSLSFQVFQQGDYRGGVGPLIRFTGPGINPSLTNLQDDNRRIVMLRTLSGLQSLEIDVRRKTVVDETQARANQYVDNENQWWALRPGVNDLTFERTGAGFTKVELFYRDGYVAA